MPRPDAASLEVFRLSVPAMATDGLPADVLAEPPVQLVRLTPARASQHYLLLRLGGLDALASSLAGNWAATRMTLAAVRRNLVSCGMHTHVGHISATAQAWAAMGFSRRQGRLALERLRQAPTLVKIERSARLGWLRVAALPEAERLVVYHKSTAPADPELGAFLPVNLHGLDGLASLLGHNHAAIRIGLRACRRAALPGRWAPGVPLTAELLAGMGVSAQGLRTALTALSACNLFEVERSANHPARVLAQPGAIKLLRATSPTEPLPR